MSDSIDEGLPNLEIKLGKMIDKLIETDEDLEKNGLNSFYFSDEHCESKYKKLFEKEIPNNSNINNSQITNNIQLNKSICNPQNLALNQINFLQNNPNNLSTIIYSNNPPNNFSNLMIPQQMNNLCNHSSFFSLNNSLKANDFGSPTCFLIELSHSLIKKFIFSINTIKMTRNIIKYLISII